ncbi:hypothetical protein [Pontibacter litorisediminis]|uniref:hypothetical protein n=1 Tax=Pontibacter litorisediminis TaxID=1846260 RepID=UPI0023EC1428|nr:hypothetical protein [Pontibacter litorisediminis]
MERETPHAEAVRAVLEDFRQTHDTQALLEGLRQVEEAGEGELWLRFFEGDTGATTISDLERYLTAPSHPNYRSITDSILLALEQGGLQVHFS